MKPENISSFEWLKYNGLFLAEHFLGKSLYCRLFGSTEKRLIESIDSKLSKTAPLANTDQYFKVFGADADVKSVRSQTQVQVFKGAAANWGCSNWTPDYFKDQYGQKPVTIFNSEGLFENGVQSLGHTTMGEYIDMLKQGSKVYLKFSPMVHDNSSLKDDFDMNWMENFSFPGSFARRFFLFIGGGKTLTPIHTALSNTVFVQIYGKKKWTFWAPNERMFLNVRAERRSYFYSSMDMNNPDQGEFPLSKYCTKFEVVLEPGDIMWFPGFFWHHVVNEVDSIGIAYKTAHMPSAIRNSAVLTLLSFLPTKPFLFESIFKTKFRNNNEQIFLD